jgi:hypothetical protein
MKTTIGSVPFVVGRIAKDGRRLMVLGQTTPPIPGPWDLRAVFAAG